MMTQRAWPLGRDLAGAGTAMITTRAVPALLPHHHRHVARPTPSEMTLPTPCIRGRAIRVSPRPDANRQASPEANHRRGDERGINKGTTDYRQRSIDHPDPPAVGFIHPAQGADNVHR